MRALYSAVTGIRTHQMRMDIIGNNIANINTTGFKATRASFTDVLSQTISAGSTQVAPQQIGLGVGLAATETMFSPGSMQLTGRDMDMAIEGDGFFVLSAGNGSNVFTRAGSFGMDSRGYLISPASGQRVQGWTAVNGALNVTPGMAPSDILIPKGLSSNANATNNAVLNGNLDSTATTWTTGFTGYDSLGRMVPLSIKFDKTAVGSWNYAVSAGGVAIPGATGTMTFDAQGKLSSAATSTHTYTPATNAATMTLKFDWSELTQTYAGPGGSSAVVRSQDGTPAGTLEAVSLDATGVVWGSFTNGDRKQLAQMAMAMFSNTGGLMKAGNSAFVESPSSGAPQIGVPGNGGRGKLLVGNLEMSNVDLSNEFSTMILTQRGFQANTKVVSTADEMLSDLVNMRR